MRPIDLIREMLREQGMGDLLPDPRQPDGRMKCPNCGKIYMPDLGPNPTPEALRNAKLIQREQCNTGICSDACWTEYLGPGEPDDE